MNCQPYRDTTWSSVVNKDWCGTCLPCGLEMVADVEVVGSDPGPGRGVPVQVVAGAGDGLGSGGSRDGDVGVVVVGMGDVDRGYGVDLFGGVRVVAGQRVGDLVSDLDLVDRFGLSVAQKYLCVAGERGDRERAMTTSAARRSAARNGLPPVPAMACSRRSDSSACVHSGVLPLHHHASRNYVGTGHPRDGRRR